MEALSRIILMVLALLALARAASAQQPAPYPVPDGISFRKATIWSEGTRMAAEVFAPASEQKLPTVIMAHGWGGTAALLREDAVAFAKAGYLVVTFDYRGWGESDARVILTAPEPAERPGNRFSAEVTELREIVDPLAEAADWFNAIHWVQGEPQSDTRRLGLWGSSFAGGLVVYVAGYDHRVKAVHSQVGPLDLRAGAALATGIGYDEATRRARGTLGYPKPGEIVVGNLRGAPIREHFFSYSPADAISLAPDCAVQIVLAGHEELFDNRTAVIDAYDRFKGAKKRLIVIPDIHPLRDLWRGARRSAEARCRMVRSAPETVRYVGTIQEPRASFLCRGSCRPRASRTLARLKIKRITPAMSSSCIGPRLLSLRRWRISRLAAEKANSKPHWRNRQGQCGALPVRGRAPLCHSSGLENGSDHPSPVFPAQTQSSRCASLTP
jgi:uncharacterized protein